MNDKCNYCKCFKVDCIGMKKHFTGCVYFVPVSVTMEKAQVAAQA